MLRLLKLLSLAAFVENGGCGLRPTGGGGAPELDNDLALTAADMCAYFADAVEHVRSDGDEFEYVELADFTLRFVTNVGVDSAAELLLGGIVASSLGLLAGTDIRVIGRKWIGETIDACWAVKIAPPIRSGRSLAGRRSTSLIDFEASDLEP